MTDLLSIGVSALLANQVGLASVGQNIANANNENYSRQETIFSALGSESGSFFSGQGVLAQGSRRLYDGYLVNQLRYSTSQLTESQALNNYTTDLGNLIGDTTTGLSNQIQDFFNAFQEASSNASSVTARATILSAANALKDRFSSVNQQFINQYTQLNGSISSINTQVNGLTDQLAKINGQLQTIGAKDALSQPNDVLDARDKILLQLSGLLDIKVVTEANGVANTYLTSGESLVVGNQSAILTTIASADPLRPDLVLKKGSQQTTITTHISSGTLGGLLSYRDITLKDFDNSLQTLATNLIASVNAQHAKGLTLNNKLGGAFFRASTDSTADLFTVVVTDRDDVALAQPVVSAAATANTGSGIISQPTIIDTSTNFFDATNKALRPPLLIRFTSATTYNILDNTNPLAPVTLLPKSSTVGLTFTPGSNNNIFASASGGTGLFTGYQSVLSGTPAAGDTFSISYNTNGFLDNRNAISLSDLQSTTLNGYSALVFAVNSVAHAAESAQASADTLFNKAKNDHQSLSGVNLDEEAAQLTKYQQTFNAAAQLIAISRTMIDDLLKIF